MITDNVQIFNLETNERERRMSVNTNPAYHDTPESIYDVID